MIDPKAFGFGGFARTRAKSLRLRTQPLIYTSAFTYWTMRKELLGELLPGLNTAIAQDADIRAQNSAPDEKGVKRDKP